MKTISLWQPWASLMACGLKKNETRHWGTSYRGPLLIHAAKRVETPTDLMRELLKPWAYTRLNDFERGALLCKVNLVDCVPSDNYAPEYPESEFGDYSPGRFVWITEMIERLRFPVFYRGHQGFFNVPDEIIGDTP